MKEARANAISQASASATPEFPVVVYWRGGEIVWGMNVSVPRHLEIVDVGRPMRPKEVDSVVESMLSLPADQAVLFGTSAGIGAVDLKAAQKRAAAKRQEIERSIRKYAGLE